MKKLVLGLLVGGLSLGAFAQGMVNMNTLASGAVLRFSNTVAQAWATNGAFSVGLYWGVDAASATNLVGPLARITTAADTLTASQWGYVTTASGGSRRDIPGRAGTATFFQLKAWSSGYASWDEAYAAALLDAKVLVSKASTHVTKSATPSDATAVPLPTATQILWGGTASAPLVVELYNPIPEPSVIALGVLGLAGAYFIRRRK